jgi:hypothetical protein
MRCPSCGRIVAQRDTITSESVVLDPRPQEDGTYVLAGYHDNPGMEGRVVRLGGRHLRAARIDQVALYRKHRCTLRLVA